MELSIHLLSQITRQLSLIQLLPPPPDTNPPVCTTRPRHTVSFYALVLQCNEYDWSYVLETSDVNCAYDRFLSSTDSLISANIPIHTVTVPHSTPTYVTPLRKNNKLIKTGKTIAADIVSAKIGKLISETRANQLCNEHLYSPQVVAESCKYKQTM